MMVRAMNILTALANGRKGDTLVDIARPLHMVPDSTRDHLLHGRFIPQRTHPFGVVDE